MSDTALDVFESLPSLKNNLAFDEAQVIVYVAGYVTRKLESVDSPKNSTFFFHEKFGSFTQHLGRGGLNIQTILLVSGACFVICFFLLLRKMFVNTRLLIFFSMLVSILYLIWKFSSVVHLQTYC